MVVTKEILPGDYLKPFVRYFALREINTPDKIIQRPLFATTDFIITFNLSDNRFGFIDPGATPGSLHQQMKSQVVISGIGTHFAGYMTSVGYSKMFSIYFTPTGFSRIFSKPAYLFTNRIDEDEWNYSSGLSTLFFKLRISNTGFEMVEHCELFIKNKLQQTKTKDPYNAIQAITHEMGYCHSGHSIRQMAIQANMSVKTFERKFIEQVGASPKLFIRINRFNQAISLKMRHPEKTWTEISLACGYFDQAHFNKDFRLFSATSPNALFTATPPVQENLVD